MSAAGKSVEIHAQAKINLALRVLGRDANGYHPIETLFMRLDLADRVVIETEQDKRALTADAVPGPAEKNLAFVAAEQFAAATGWPEGWQIRIEKRIPVGAGLGGGSSDAAAVLRGLNRISPNPVAEEKLQEIAARIGADVAFLTSDSVFAFAEGYGQKLTKLPELPGRTVGLAVPAFGISTRDAYSWIDSDGAMRADRQRWDLNELSWERIDKLLENDFTQVVARRQPEIETLIEWFLDQGAVSAGMTGSGSVVFGLFDQVPARRSDSLPVEGKVLWTSTAARVVEPRLLG